ncbi:MAG: hypothetical protein DRN27_06510 [Thermoplasmata archaeon]|nr:MAG: hypothetical protein DRN27_06510 [Thermoplasmata archaeon]
MEKKINTQIQQDLINLQLKNDIICHNMKMEELKFVRETEKIHHDNEMTRQRIKSAEIKKAFDRKQASQYPRKQW